MYEIRIHGRGGQGVKTTSHILSRAAFLEGMKTQDFAMYGAERRGAPVVSFCRISKDQVLTRGYIFEPDCVIVLDPTIGAKACIAGLKKGGTVIVNSSRRIKEFGNAVFADATKIAMEEIGKPIPNAAILGSFLKAINIVKMESLTKAIKEELTEDGHPEAVQGNVRALQLCWEKTNV